MRKIALFSLILLAACSIDPSKNRIYDPDEEFAKLDSPEVPTVQGALEKSAVRAFDEGEFENAVALYQQLAEQDPKNKKYLYGLAESLRRANEFQASVAVYNEVSKQYPGDVDVEEGRGLAMMGMGETAQASGVFKVILAKDPTRWRTLNALGILFAIKGMNSEALAYFKEALRHKANQPSVLNNMALVQAIQQQYREAVKSFDTALRHSEGAQRQQIDMNLALVHGVSGDMDAAREVASRYLKGAALDNNLGLYAHLANNQELAKSYLNMALTSSTTFYKRAWQNLDMIAKEGQKNNPGFGSKRLKVN